MATRVIIKDSHRSLKVFLGDRGFKAEVFGTGSKCTVEIDEMNMQTGHSTGRRRSYKVPGRIKWSVIVGRYIDDTNKRMPY